MLKDAIKRGLLLYDSDCGFCRFWLERWKRKAPGAFEAAPLKDAPRRPPRLGEDEYLSSAHYQSPDGRWSSGAEAVLEALAAAPRGGAGRWLYRRVPGFAPAAEALYAFVARHRVAASRLTAWLWGRDPEPPSWSLARWAFLRALALLSAVAFASYWLQIDGLIGSQGILPARELMDTAARVLPGHSGYWQLPTIGWWFASDRALHAICAGGLAASLLAFAGVLPGPALLAAWALYLSLCSMSQEFLGYQWDILLLETLLIGALWAPWRLRPRFADESRPLSAPRWLLRWLLFRLMFQSGVVKLASGDPTWRNLSALWYHYRTQPLPTWIGWYADQLPHGAQTASAAAMFAVELGAPWLIFSPRRPRLLAAGALAVLQALIGLTGNYCFFNLLTIALCLTLLEDRDLRRLVPARLRFLREPERRPEPRRWAIRARAAACAILALLGAVPLWLMLGGRPPAALTAAYAAAEPFRSVNGYGLFAVMTTKRLEIEVEGSVDGRDWKPYVFPYKPGPLDGRPRFVEPMQPRLDWQMWFAALGDCRSSPWFLRFMARLLMNSKPVLALLAKNPFPDAPPRYIRTTLYDYRFTTWSERRRTGDWWARTPVGPYCPILERR